MVTCMEPTHGSVTPLELTLVEVGLPWGMNTLGGEVRWYVMYEETM